MDKHHHNTRDASKNEHLDGDVNKITKRFNTTTTLKCSSGRTSKLWKEIYVNDVSLKAASVAFNTRCSHAELLIHAHEMSASCMLLTPLCPAKTR